MDDGKATVYGLSSTVCFAGVVARAPAETDQEESSSGKIGIAKETQCLR